MPFDAERSWQLSPQVALRPEGFGALAYHFGTRRLSFLKSRELRDLVLALSEHGSASAAFEARDIPVAERGRYEKALATLAESGMITERGQGGEPAAGAHATGSAEATGYPEAAGAPA